MLRVTKRSTNGYDCVVQMIVNGICGNRVIIFSMVMGCSSVGVYTSLLSYRLQHNRYVNY